MSFASSTDAPIYETLIGERGDVPAETRRAAEQVQREVAQALDFSTVHAPLGQR
ncbi:hypothetical protein [Streptomyces sp. GC420]|uniref:hypothetical protein n=1 Tax=Streptomyces sp. GC420 TaxID=2697568 RepID=UPI001414FB44|nr:hypothetical protein [Streptomyces sp. GC420]